MNNYNEFTFQVPRTLPIILLLDTSASMLRDNKIVELNLAVNEMVKVLKDIDSVHAAASLSVITFGGHAKKILELTSVQDVPLLEFEANGDTPLGEALTIAKDMIEDKEIITSRTYRPVVVLVSDGMPNDDWAESFKTFKNEGRSSKCYCVSMGIGEDLSRTAIDILQKFSSGQEKIFLAKEAKDIHKFFGLVSDSVVSRTKSQNPNLITSITQNI